jgi:hypothetical protein
MKRPLPALIFTLLVMRKSFTVVALIVLVLLLLRAHVVLAEQGGIPGPPPVPVPLPPCISTAPLDTPVSSFYLCTVRNIGPAAHTVTIAIRDNSNVDVTVKAPVTLTPGTSTNLTSPVTGTESQLSCVVTTAEGTTDALQDLAVVLQIELQAKTGEGIVGLPSGETEGNVFPQCAPATTPPTRG